MAGKNTKTAKEAVDQVTAENTNTGVATAAQYQWTRKDVDEDTGEEIDVPIYKYMPGMPREYRFDAKTGTFSIGANSVIGDTLSVHPIAWRFFTDDIFQLGPKFWAELFFIDDKNCVAALLFHSASAQELQKLAEPLYYDEKGLNDVIIDIYVTQHVNNKIKPAASYCIARFDKYRDADPEKVKEYKAFAKAFPIFRKTSWQPTASGTVAKFYYDLGTHQEQAALEDAGTGAEVTE
jgi:hypothetical protein